MQSSIIVYFKEWPVDMATHFLVSVLKPDFEDIIMAQEPTLDCLVKTTLPDGTVIRSTIDYDRYKANKAAPLDH